MLRVDAGIPLRLEEVPRAVRRNERLGFDGAWVGELNHDAFLPLVLAAEHSESLQIGTSIAVAFARSPMNVAGMAWDLQTYSRGRFILGLGSQIQPHIERRFSMPWGRPVKRMREFVGAVRAIWAAWEGGSRLDFQGEYYTHNLMTPMFVPEPHGHPHPPIYLAAVGEAMTQLTGEIADGMHTHAFTTERYVREVTLPALRTGLDLGGRLRQDFSINCPVFVVTGERDEDLEAARGRIRAQLAFYASTPAYRPVLDLHGWGDLQPELRSLSRRGGWTKMASLIDDEVMETFAIVAPLEGVAEAVRQRYDRLVDRVMLTCPVGLSDEAVGSILTTLRSSDVSVAPG